MPQSSHAEQAEARSVLAPVFGVRVAGMAVGDLEDLRFTRTWSLLDELLETSATVASEGAALSEALHEVIGGNARPDRKPLLVALRRALFCTRVPQARTRSEEVLRALPNGLDRRITAWLGHLERRDALEGALPGVLAAERREKTTRLREVVAADAFRRGLAQSSPVLSAELDKWLAGQADAVPGRQTLLRLTRYVARVAAKTSPYATFTAAGFGHWTEHGPAVVPAQRLVRRSVAELHPFVVERIWQALADRPELIDRVRLRVNPSATEEEGRIWFLGAGPSEPIRSAPAVDAVRAVLDAVRTATYPTEQALRARFGHEGQAARVVTVLLEAGLLERRRPYADQSGDSLGELIAWLPADHPAAGALRRLDEAVATYPALTSAAERAHRAQQIDEQARILSLGEVPVGLSPLSLGEESVRIVTPSPETTLLIGGVTRCGKEQWRPVFDDLDAVRELLGLLDMDLPVKLAAAALFRERYGPSASVPFLRFYRHAHQTAELRALLHPPPGGNPGDGPSDLAELRRQTWRTLRAAGEDPAGVIRVDPALVRKLAASWPRHVRAPRSICCYGQALTTPQGPGLVVNTIACGYGRGLGRLHHLLARVTDGIPALDRHGIPALDRHGFSVPDRHEISALDRHEVAECLGAFGTSLNLRPPVGRPIDYPFTTDDSPDALAPAELRVGYEPERQLVVLRDAGGSEVRPMHLGLLAPYLLPPAYSFLVRVFGEPPVALPPGRRLGGGRESGGRESGGRESGGRESGGRGSGAWRWPRLEVGRVTLARACWRLPAGELPTPGKGEGEAAYLVRFARWLAEHGIPRRFFARVIPADRAKGFFTKARKPLYVDAANCFLLFDLARAAGNPGDLVVLEEVLPDLADNPRYGDDGTRVTEYMFQLTATGERA
ncbi:lantibiotic dehydratase [Nonomuraea sp. NPDC049158]|uniref:lantibiotic dehydratase n=1 Tax=Nonomuraea sp. NPDC049158 TaxID=3155649 RepID=UPI0034114C0B